MADIDDEVAFERETAEQHAISHVRPARQADFHLFGDRANSNPGAYEIARFKLSIGRSDASCPADERVNESPFSVLLNHLELYPVALLYTYVLNVDGTGASAGVHLRFELFDVPVKKVDPFDAADDYVRDGDHPLFFFRTGHWHVDILRRLTREEGRGSLVEGGCTKVTAVSGF